MLDTAGSRHPGAAATSPADWASTLSGPPTLDRTVCGATPFALRHWRSIDSDMEQPPLDRHFVALHLGGAKRLRREGEGPAQVRDAACGSFSVVPAGASFRWTTEGPVDFAHIYFEDSFITALIEQAFGRNPAGISLRESFACDDQLIYALATTLLKEVRKEAPQRAITDGAAYLLLLQILRKSSNIGDHDKIMALQIAPFRLKRAIDFIEEHLASPVSVSDIASAAGVSAFHFSRSFKHATGLSPYAFLIERRIRLAKSLLGKSWLTLSTVAGQCGFNSPNQFSRAFRRVAGLTPSQFRRSL